MLKGGKSIFLAVGIFLFKRQKSFIKEPVIGDFTAIIIIFVKRTKR